jgi:hypothetical protein
MEMNKFMEFGVRGAIALGIFGLSVSAANAQLLFSNSVDRGSYTDAGDHINTGDSYLTGYDSFDNVQYRSFVVFDIPTLTGTDTYTSAVVNIYNGGTSIPNAADMAGRTFTISSIATDLTTLRAGGTGLTSIYNDLGAGTNYGSITFLSTPGNASTIKFNINAAGLSAINSAAGSQIAFGGSFDVNNTTTDQYIFGFSGSGTPGDGKTRLDLVVNNFVAPEPSTFALLSMAPIGIGIVARRLRRRDN